MDLVADSAEKIRGPGDIERQGVKLRGFSRVGGGAGRTQIRRRSLPIIGWADGHSGVVERTGFPNQCTGFHEVLKEQLYVLVVDIQLRFEVI